jgi:2',3'-cyclic-nucleotide 2'-phosphodiesterase/3'-nucleotidase/5'-nucleotidase
MRTPLLVLALLASAQTLAAQETARIVVVATTDIHGRVHGWDFVEKRAHPGGLTRAATVIDSLRARYPGQVVLVDAGDLIEGDAFAAHFQENPREPHPILDAMDALEYDAIVPGNHDFNFGLEFFRRSYVGRNFRVVCANCVLPGAGFQGADSLMFLPFHTVTRGGVRVAIAGLTTPGAMVWDGDKLRGRALIRAVGERTPLFGTMRASADLVISVIHSGLDGAAGYDTTGVGDENVAASLASMRLKPDLVVVGHSHREIVDTVINGVHFVQPRPLAQSLSVSHVTLTRTGGAWRVTSIRGEAVPLAGVAESQRLARRLEPHVTATRQWTSELIGFTSGAFDGRIARAGASPLTNWMAEVMRRTARADIAATPAFTTRRGLPDGDVTRADLFGIYPYENTLRSIRVSGAQLRSYLEHSARHYGLTREGRLGIDPRVPGYNFDVVVGIDYDLDPTKPVGQRVVRFARGGRAIAATDSFTMAINSYRQTGSGGYSMIQGARVVRDSGENVRDLLEAAIRRDTLRASRYAREGWRIVPLEMEDQARILGGAQPRPRAALPRDTVQLRVLAINDLHGQLAPRTWPWSGDRPVGGVSHLKTLIDSLSAECDCPVVKLDGGDQFQGTLASNVTFGRPIVEALSRIGLHAAAAGNHDFDWGVDTLRRRVAGSRYTWLASNVVDSASGQRPEWLKAWTMISAGPRQVAVVGYAHPATPAMTLRAATRGLRFLPGPEPIKAAITEARAAGAELVLLVAHYGGNCSETCGGELFALVDSLGPNAVDAVFGGHSHGSVVGRTAGGIPVVQGGSSGRAVARVDLVRKVDGSREVRSGLDTVWADRIRSDRGIDSILARYLPSADSVARRRVAEIATPMARRGNEHALGRLLADAYRSALRTDLAIINNGGIRRDIEAGVLTYGTAYELMPFGNRLVKVTLPGSAVRLLLEEIVSADGPDAHISGFTVEYDPRAQKGRRIKQVRTADGRNLDNRRQYTLTVNDFMAQGGEQYGILTRFPQESEGMVDLDGFLGYLRRIPQPVRPPDGARFTTR